MLALLHKQKGSLQVHAFLFSLTNLSLEHCAEEELVLPSLFSQHNLFGGNLGLFFLFCY